jgi:hypothetical protein
MQARDPKQAIAELKRLAEGFLPQVELLLLVIPTLRRRAQSIEARQRLRRTELNLMEIRDFLASQNWADDAP